MAAIQFLADVSVRKDGVDWSVTQFVKRDTGVRDAKKCVIVRMDPVTPKMETVFVQKDTQV